MRYKVLSAALSAITGAAKAEARRLTLPPLAIDPAAEVDINMPAADKTLS